MNNEPEIQVLTHIAQVHRNESARHVNAGHFGDSFLYKNKQNEKSAGLIGVGTLRFFLNYILSLPEHEQLMDRDSN